MAFFRSPSHRKQIGIIAEREFKKNRLLFMSAYFQETERAFGYIFVNLIIAKARRVFRLLSSISGYKQRREIGRNSQNDQ